jgi:threonine dehydratase
MATFAEGLATRTAFELPQKILRDLLDDFILVSEQELRHAMLVTIETTRNLAEGAGAAALAGALKVKDQLKDKKVAVVCSGGNVTTQQLRELLG